MSCKAGLPWLHGGHTLVRDIFTEEDLEMHGELL